MMDKIFLNFPVKNISGVVFLFLTVVSMAQERPFINSISKTSGTVNEKVIINGSHFPTTTDNTQVLFGTGTATVIKASASQIEVLVPATATYGPITVMDKSTGYSSVSMQYFTLSFEGDGFELSQMGSQSNFTTGLQEPYDICTCDFDGDGSADAAVSNNASNSISVFRNSSTASATVLIRRNFGNGFGTTNTECGDLDGDGLPDLVFTNNTGLDPEHVFIWKNESSPGSTSFTKVMSFKLPPTSNGDARNARKILIDDVDNDGIKDLIIGNDTDGNILIYKGNNPTSISFDSTPIAIEIPGATRTGSLAIGDLDKDGFRDMVVIPFDIANAAIYILKNTSTPGNVSFKSGSNVLDFINQRIEVVLGDFNNDNFLDIASTSRTNSEIEILLNTGANLQFEAPVKISVPRPWGLTSADFDGDGLLDIATASVTGGIYLSINASTAQAFSFEDPIAINTSNTTRNIDAVDLNGDSKPDLAFTHNITSGAFGDLTVIPNRNCLTPSIKPGDITFCTGSPFTVSATKTTEATYSWAAVSGDVSITEMNDQAEIIVNNGTSATIQVTITSDDGNCTNSSMQTFTLTGGSPPVAPDLNLATTGTICSGQNFTLSTSTTGQDEYIWTLPDGSETITNTPSLSQEASSATAGTYQLRVRSSGSCASEASSEVVVSVDEPPYVSIINNDNNNFCEGSSVALEVPEYEGFDYQWYNSSTAISGATSASYSATASGDYAVALISESTGCQKASSPLTVEAVTPPQSAISSAEEVCVEAELVVSGSNSTSNSAFDVTYQWDFGDGTTASGVDTSHTYSSAQSYTISLTTAYNDIDQCAHTETFDVTVSEPVQPSIAAPTTEKCPTDSVRLELPNNFRSYNWSTGDSTFFTYAKTSPEEDEVTLSATGITDIGCAYDVSATIANYANSQIELTSSEGTIENNVLNLESGVSTVELTATNGTDYSWEPEDILSIRQDGASVVVYPKTRETVVSVTGTDNINGCITTASVTITTPGIIPRKSFSPNGDGQGFDCWEILNSERLEGCHVYVFDQRGRHVYQGSSPFESDCVWNGNIDNGNSPAPEGVYYFVMKCDNGDYNKTGTILLAR